MTVLLFILSLLAGGIGFRLGQLTSTQDAHKKTIREHIVCHEAGHAICMWVNPHVTKLTQIRISDNFGSVTCNTGDQHSEAYQWHLLVSLLGGVAGEWVALWQFTPSHAQSDFRKAREIASQLASTAIRPPWRVPDTTRGFDIVSVFKAGALTADEREIFRLAYAKAVWDIETHRKAFDAICLHLNRSNTIDVHDVTRLIERVGTM